jgi:hypothetical protein
MNNFRAFLRYICDEVVWVMWLYFHPFTLHKLVIEDAEYQQKRSVIIAGFRNWMSRAR